MRNILIRHMRFRGNGLLYTGTLEIGGGVSGWVLDHVSTADGSGYALPISPVATSELNEPIRSGTVQWSLIGLPHTFSPWARTGAAVSGTFGGLQRPEHAVLLGCAVLGRRHVHEPVAGRSLLHLGPGRRVLRGHAQRARLRRRHRPRLPRWLLLRDVQGHRDPRREARGARLGQHLPGAGRLGDPAKLRRRSGVSLRRRDARRAAVPAQRRWQPRPCERRPAARCATGAR